MAGPAAKTRLTLDKVVALRVEGVSWHDTAERLGVSCSLISHYPSQFPDIWSEAYSKAWRAVVREAGTEAMDAQRRFLQRGLAELDKKKGSVRLMRLGQAASATMLKHMEHAENIIANAENALATTVTFVDVDVVVDADPAKMGLIDHTRLLLAQEGDNGNGEDAALP